MTMRRCGGGNVIEIMGNSIEMKEVEKQSVFDVCECVMCGEFSVIVA